MTRFANIGDQSYAELFHAYKVAKVEGEQDYLQDKDGYALTCPVGRFRPNAFGLYDMHGNAAEWCFDVWASPYVDAAIDDPIVSVVIDESNGGVPRLRGGSPGATVRVQYRDNKIRDIDRVVRGGGFSEISRVRSAARTSVGPFDCDHRVSFRVAREL